MPSALALHLLGKIPRFHAQKIMKITLIAFSICAAFVSISGCSTIAERTNMLTDDQIKSQTAGALGYSPTDLSITSRRTEGVNTYVNLIATNHKEYTCILNGGNLLTMGMTNPPQCAKRGEPINGNPLLQ
jgi:hypothetical protein